MPNLNTRQRAKRKQERDARGFCSKKENPQQQQQRKQQQPHQSGVESRQMNPNVVFLNLTNNSTAEEIKVVNRMKQDPAKARGPYNGTGRTTKYYRQKKDGSKALLDTYNELRTEQENDFTKRSEINLMNSQNIESTCEALDTYITPQINKNSHLNQQIDYENQKYRAVYYYFIQMLKGRKKIKASTKAARTAMGNKISKRYLPYAVRQWAKEYLQNGTIAPHLQGRHAKRISLLNDEDVQEQARSWFMSIKPEKRSLFDFCKYINNTVIPQKIGVVGKVSLSVLLKYLPEWGYQYSKHTKDVFFDGHESPDVVEYRSKWLPKMLEYKKRMESYSGENMEIVTEPVLQNGSKKLVMVTHDEACFFSNDSKMYFWKHEDESVIRKKTPGGSVMVSEFQCQCHGTMRLPDGGKDSRVYLQTGINREGYWKSEDMVKQLKDVIKLFNYLHLDSQGLFAFDQSSNHTAYPSDALRVARMNLNSSPLKDKQVPMRNGWYIKNNQRVEQEFYIKKSKEEANESGQIQVVEQWIAKGVRKILEERGLGLWEEYSEMGKTWKFKCTNKYATDDGKCCPYHLLSLQPDFLEQKSSLQEIVEESGHLFTLYPKFHCELNWIKRYWGNAKCIARKECDYSYASLKEKIPSFLDQVSPPNDVPTKLRRFYGRCWKLIEAYNKEEDGKKAYYSVVKKYKNKRCTSHRRIGINE